MKPSSEEPARRHIRARAYKADPQSWRQRAARAGLLPGLHRWPVHDHALLCLPGTAGDGDRRGVCGPQHDVRTPWRPHPRDPAWRAPSASAPCRVAVGVLLGSVLSLSRAAFWGSRSSRLALERHADQYQLLRRHPVRPEPGRAPGADAAGRGMGGLIGFPWAASCPRGARRPPAHRRGAARAERRRVRVAYNLSSKTEIHPQQGGSHANHQTGPRVRRRRVHSLRFWARRWSPSPIRRSRVRPGRCP